MKTQHFVILIISFFTLGIINAQSGTWKYSKTGTSGFFDVMFRDTSNNIYLTGRFDQNFFRFQNVTVPGNSIGESTSSFFIKTAANGRLIWMQSAYPSGSSGSVNIVKSITNTRGELIAIIYTDNTSQLNIAGYQIPSDPAVRTVYIVKFSKTGILSWIKEFDTQFLNGNKSDMEVSDFTVDNNDFVYITGWFLGTTFKLDTKTISGFDNTRLAFVSKISSAGIVNWISPNKSFSGSDATIQPKKITVNKDGFIYINGFYSGATWQIFNSDTLQIANGFNIFLARFATDGKPDWALSFTGDQNDLPGNLFSAPDGTIYMDGFFASSNFRVGAKNYASVGSDFDYIIVHLGASGVIISSTSIQIQKQTVYNFGENAYLSLDPNGDLVFCSDFFSNQVFSSSDALFNSNTGTGDIAFAKMDPTDYEPIWTAQISGSGDNYYEGINVDSDGNVIMSGTLFTPIALNSTPISANGSFGTPYLSFVNNAGTVDYFVTKNNSSNGRLFMDRVISDPYGNSYVGGTFDGLINILSSDTIENKGQSGVFLTKYGRTKNISGYVKNELGEKITDGYVKLYGYSYALKSTVSDSIKLNTNGAYLFQNVPYGKYLLVAVPGSGSSAEYMDTYYPDAETWATAKSLEVVSDFIGTNVNITLLSITNPVGLAGLTGSITEVDRSDVLKSTSKITGKPSKKATVVLAVRTYNKSTYEAYYTVESDESGDFIFTNVEDGTYDLWVEIAGLPVDDPYTVSVEGSQFVSSLNYYIDEDKIIKLGDSATTKIVEPNIVKTLNIKPNPANTNLYISATQELPATIEFLNYSGQVIYKRENSVGNTSIDISGLENGTYLVRITTNDKMTLDKLVIQH